MTEVILKQEIRRLGAKGDLVRVADGYARNYLIPKQLAMPATFGNKQQLEQMRAAADREALAVKGDAEKLAKLLSDVVITIAAKAGEADQLFGSVTSRDIAAELEKLGFTIDRHKIVIHGPIRQVGEHEVSIHLHRDIDVPIKVRVLAEGREDQPQGEAAATEQAAEPEVEESAAEESGEEK
jgi:large subunit ribosomal protein L9